MTTSFLIELTVLILAAFLGFEVISKVPTLLHTPLMSGSNAIHGIVVVGAIIVASLPDQTGWVRFVALLAVALGTGNVVGGFVVTDRMLQMFKRREPAEEGAGRVSRGDWVSLAYIVTIVCFILALRYLSDPARARHGNWIGAFGMAVAIVATFFLPGLDSDQFVWVILVMAVTAPIGAYAARAVKMTAMPQMVALFNGVGGGAAALIALADFHNSIAEPGDLDLNVSIAIVLSALIGSVSFAGSMVAFAKLQELMTGRPITYPGQKYGNLLLLAVLVGLGVAIVAGVEKEACSSRSSSARSRSACCSCCPSAAPTCPSSSRSSTRSRASPHRRPASCCTRPCSSSAGCSSARRARC